MSQSLPPDDQIPHAEFATQTAPQSYVPKVLPPPQENGFGIAGFIASIIGVVTCGSLSIFGVILSTIGLKKEPKGLAVAGLILGLIGLVELVGFGFLAYAGYQTAQSVGSTFNQFANKALLQQKAMEVASKWEEDETLPSQADGDEIMSSTTDLWGNVIEYETDGSTFSIRSPGQDGIAYNADDIVVGPFADAEAAQESPYGDFELPEDMDLEGMDVEGLEDMDIEGIDMEQIKKQMEKVQKAIEESNEN